MDNLDVSKVLKTYSEKARLAKNTAQLREIVKELKRELDLGKIKMPEWLN